MLADDAGCNARNPYSGRLFLDTEHSIDVYPEDVEVDYRGNEVTVDTFLGILTGRHPPGTPSSKMLRSTKDDTVLVYITGHGGEEFFKFQDYEILTAADVGMAIEDMHSNERYGRLLFLSDTCKAGTLANRIPQSAPPGSDRPLNVVSVGSSRTNENSYGHEFDPDVGVALIDRFTYAMYMYISGVAREGVVPNAHSRALAEQQDAWVTHAAKMRKFAQETPLAKLWGHMDPGFLGSNVDVRTFDLAAPLSALRLFDFFGDEDGAEVRSDLYPVELEDPTPEQDPLAFLRDAAEREKLLYESLFGESGGAGDAEWYARFCDEFDSVRSEVQRRLDGGLYWIALAGASLCALLLDVLVKES
mmetsp:Transcript_43563/g.136640  ORF Transcript_43563/g.136640 Transcript_43563/m.136640 type:complete len:360 (+) Transcript_43563:517-1596(+)